MRQEKECKECGFAGYYTIEVIEKYFYQYFKPDGETSCYTCGFSQSEKVVRKLKTPYCKICNKKLKFKV